MYPRVRWAILILISQLLVMLLLSPGAAIAQAPQLPPAAAPTAASVAGTSTAAASSPNKTPDKTANATSTAPRPYDAPSRRTRSWIFAAIAGTVGVVAVILLVRHYHNNRGCGNCLASGN